MEAVFLRIVNMSLSAAAVIAVVVLLRLSLRRAPKKWRYLLWIAPAFRLACPVSFRAVFSIFRLRPPLEAASAPAAAGVGNMTYITRPVVISPVSSVPAAQAAIPSGVLTAPMATAQASVPVQAAASVDPMQVWLAVGTAIWLAGLAVMLILGVVRYLRMKGKLADAAKLENGVYASDAIRIPFILGLLPPKVYIPAGLEGKELRYVLAHERAHLRRGDHWAKLLAYLLLSLHWFDPLVWLAFYLMSRDMEMSCDERVLSDMEGEAKDYSRTLLGYAVGRRFPAPAPLAFGESDVGSRIKNALRWRRPRLWVTVLAAVLCLAAVAACTANPKEKTEETPAPAIDLKASDIHEARLLNPSLSQVYGLNETQRDELIRLLDAVPADKIVQGRGIPSEKRLEMMGVDYALRFAGGIIELDFDDPAAAAEKYGPAVWEIHDEALYDWLEALWAENAAVLEPEQKTEPHLTIPDIAADTGDDTVSFGFAEGRLALLGAEGKTNQDVIDVVPFDNLIFRAEDNFLSPGGQSVLSGGTLWPGMSVMEVKEALFGGIPEDAIGQQQLEKPQLVLHPDIGADDYPVTGVYAGQLFDMSLLYSSGGEVIGDINLSFLPNEGEDHAATLYALIRSALIQQLGPPQKEEPSGHYDKHETSYDKDGNAINSSEPVDYVMAVWWDEDATLTLTLEIGQYYSRSLTIHFYETIYYVEETGTTEASYPAWKEAFYKLVNDVILPETEYDDGTGPVLDIALADLSGDGVPELICYLPGGGKSHAAAIVTFEEGEARAFNADCTFGLPLAKNAVENAFAANPESPDFAGAAFRWDPVQGFWTLNSANGTELDRWCTWYRFGADQNGYLAAEQLVSLDLSLELAEDGYREISWEVNGESVTSEAYHAIADEYDAWLENLCFHPFDSEQRIKFFSLRERSDDLPDRLAAWLGIGP